MRISRQIKPKFKITTRVLFFAGAISVFAVVAGWFVVMNIGTPGKMKAAAVYMEDENAVDFEVEVLRLRQPDDALLRSESPSKIYIEPVPASNH